MAVGDEVLKSIAALIKSHIRDNDILNLLTIAPSKVEEKVFIGSYYSGLLELDLSDKTINLYNKYNSKIDGAQGDYQRDHPD